MCNGFFNLNDFWTELFNLQIPQISRLINHLNSTFHHYNLKIHYNRILLVSTTNIFRSTAGRRWLSIMQQWKRRQEACQMMNRNTFPSWTSSINSIHSKSVAIKNVFVKPVTYKYPKMTTKTISDERKSIFFWLLWAEYYVTAYFTFLTFSFKRFLLLVTFYFFFSFLCAWS